MQANHSLKWEYKKDLSCTSLPFSMMNKIEKKQGGYPKVNVMDEG